MTSARCTNCEHTATLAPGQAWPRCCSRPSLAPVKGAGGAPRGRRSRAPAAAPAGPPSPSGVVRLVLPGAPRTKKTSNRLVKHEGRQKVIPSKAWCCWRNKVAKPLKKLLAHGCTLDVQNTADSFTIVAAAGTYPISWPVNCAAIFYRDRAQGDAVGFHQGLADVLQEAGVLIDDKWIATWDGSRLDKDAARPRVEILLTWEASP